MKNYKGLLFSFLCVAFTCTQGIAQMNYEQAAIAQAAGKGRKTDASSGNIKLSDHPRLFFSKGGEALVLAKARNNALLSRMIGLLKEEADKELSSVPQNYKPDAELLAVSREQIKRLVTLSMAYRLFKDGKYAAKVQDELLNVCKFPSWHPEHFLDVAEMTTAVAIGYDWCYDQLSPETKVAAENAIRQKGFEPAWPIYESTEKTTPFNRENNWNMVCNSGMLNGAIALGDKYPDEMQRILKYAVKYTPHLLESFAPEGVYNEGPSYWGYNAMYMGLFFDNLERNIHNDYGLTRFKGLDNTADYYKSLISPSGRNYNFGDGSENVDNSATFFLLSKLYKQPQVADFYRRQIASDIREYSAKGKVELSRFFFLSIPWFDDAQAAAREKENRLTVFQGVTDFLFFNANGSDKNRLWLAAKTGRPSWSHNHLDVGSFIVECEGERWGIDPGPDSYSLPKFWDYEPGGARWNYFRNTNLAHNTITIDGRITNSNGQGELLRTDEKSAKPYGIINMDSGYNAQASSVLRGFKLLSPGVMLVRDEIVLKPGSKKIAWRFLTNAAVTIDGNTATLSQNGKKFYIQCLSTDGFSMQSFPAQTNTPAEKPLKNITIVEISSTPSVQPAVFPVLMGNNLQDIRSFSKENTELNKW